MKSTLTRRDFLKYCGIGTAGAAVAFALAGCSDSSSSDSSSGSSSSSSNTSDLYGDLELSNSGTDSLKDVVFYQTAENDTFDMFYSNAANLFQITANLVDALVTHDIFGNMVGCLATDWSTDDDGKTWTFHIRDDVVWVDYEGNYKADMTSQDWITGLEWVLNYWESEGKNASFATDTIQGALDYYEYTQAMDEDDAKNVDYDVFLDMVGIETPDDYTIVYHCVDEIVYFDTLATYVVLYPLPLGEIEELGVDGYIAVDPFSLWYSGPYVISAYVNGNEKTLTPNPQWWDTESKRFDSITWKVVDSADTAYLMFQSDEFDTVTLSESNIRAIADNESHEYHDYTVIEHGPQYAGMLFFNFNKKLDDGSLDDNWNKAVENENFRKAIYYGVDLTDFLGRQNALDPLASQGYSLTSPGLCFIDGEDYVTYVEKMLGLDSSADHFDRYDAELGAQYISQAKEELAAAGVTFPIEMDYWISASSQTALDTANVLKATMERDLGSDFVDFEIKAYVSSQNTEVFVPSLFSIRYFGWSADFGDPIAVLGLACTDKSENNFANNCKAYDTELTKIIDLFDEYTALTRKADAIHSDMQERYKAFAEAEVFAIENVMFLPIYKTSNVELTRINDYTKPLAGYGIQHYKLINIDSSTELYSIEDYAKLEEAYNAAKG